MKLTFLGTGTSQGVPVIGCRCEVCASKDRRNNRLRTSAMVEMHGVRMVIDAGPDFRCQMLRTGVRQIDAILLTHEHKDHIGGLDDVRAFNYVDFPIIRRVAIYATHRTLECVRKDFDYAFVADKYRGVPEIALYEVDTAKIFCVGSGADDVSTAGESQPLLPQKAPDVLCSGVGVMPIAGHHSPRFEVTGYRIGKLAYLTDFKSIDDVEVEKLLGVDVLVVNALRHESHPSHFNIDQALELIGRVAPREAYLTHMSHEIGLHATNCAALPEGVYMAYDMLQIEIDE